MDAVTQLSGQLRSRPISHLSVIATTACLDVFAMSLGLWFACFSTLPAFLFDPVSTGLWAGLCAVATAGFGAFFRSYDPQTLMTVGSNLIYGLSGFFVLLGVASLVDLGQGVGLQWLLQSAAFVVPLMLGHHSVLGRLAYALTLDGT